MDLLAFFVISQNLMKDECITKFQITFENFYPNFNVDSDKYSLRNTVF